MSNPSGELHQPMLTHEDTLCKDLYGLDDIPRDPELIARLDRYGRESPAIGIDLGTHSCRVAICLNGKVEILAIDQASRATPSWVSFTDAGRLVGDAAKNQAAINEKNTVYGVKRLMGRKFSDEAVQSGLKHWPFNVVNFDGRPRVSVECGGETKLFSPEEITAVILTKMKETAEAFIGQKVKNAVITVPSHYNFLQRQAIKLAGTISGLNVSRIKIEQEAVVVAYHKYERPVGIKHVLIFNLGAATFEVSFFPVNHGGLDDVKASSGGAHLGGDDFDNRLVAHCLRVFTRKHDKDISKNLKALGRLKTACEQAKITLSSCTEASIAIDSLLEGITFCITISRETFEDLCEDLFRLTIESLESFLMAAKLDKSMIDDVVLVGGSTRIPKVQKLVTDFFNGKVPNTSMDPDEAVVLGAAMLAEAHKMIDYVDDRVIVGYSTVSLGVETAGGVVTPLVSRGAMIPCVTSLTFSTHSDNQSGVTVRVFKGESSTAKDNDLIGAIGLMGIAPAPRGVPQLQVTFDIGVEGVLYVTVQDKSTTKFYHVQIQEWGRNYHVTSLADFDNLTWCWELWSALNAPKSEAKYELENYDYTPKAVCDKLSNPATITARSPWTAGMKWLKDLLHMFSPSVGRMDGLAKWSHQNEPREENFL